MSFQFLTFEPDADGLVLITVNRPSKLNALNRDVISELEEAFRIVREDSSIRGLILTGAGDKAFIAGADIGELAEIDPLDAERASRTGQQIFRSLETMRKPSVAAIGGYALGGGLELAMCCTIRIASESAKLGQPEVKLGLVPGYGGTQRLPRLVGRGRALEMLLSAEPIGASEAYRIGLVNTVVPRERLIPAAKEWALKVLENSPVAVGLVMEAVDAGLNGGIDEGLRFESAAFGLAAASGDRREGTTAFLEKRKAAFTNRLHQ
jgi:enoyl-CoA hydratase